MSTRLPGEQPPTPDEPNRLKEWLSRMMILINGMMDTHLEDMHGATETTEGLPVVKGFGGLYHSPGAGQVPTPINELTYEKILGFDGVTPGPPNAPYGISPSVPDDDIVIDVDGVYTFGYALTFTFTPGTFFEITLFVDGVATNIINSTDPSNQTGEDTLSGSGLGNGFKGLSADLRAIKLGGLGNDITMISGHFFTTRLQ
jgi:hypothetical protein